jgi:two-component system chemotaxis response regulator CheB
MFEPHPWNSRPSAISVVALVASAGGLAAFRTILSRLPSDFPAPVLICQHRGHRAWERDPLIELLARRSRLCVVEAHDGAHIKAGTAYVCPPNRHLLMRNDRCIVLSDSDALNRNRPSADLLLESLAAQFGPRLLVVVLSGSLSDGAVGVVKVKARGGRVIVQQPSTASCPGMPNAAISSGCADFVLPMDRIADALTTLAMVPGATELFVVRRPAWTMA